MSMYIHYVLEHSSLCLEPSELGLTEGTQKLTFTENSYYAKLTAK